MKEKKKIIIVGIDDIVDLNFNFFINQALRLENEFSKSTDVGQNPEIVFYFQEPIKKWYDIGLEKGKTEVEEKIKRVKDILNYRYGITKNHEFHSLAETARRDGVTRERIRQIEARVFRDLIKWEYHKNYKNTSMYSMTQIINCIKNNPKFFKANELENMQKIEWLILETEPLTLEQIEVYGQEDLSRCLEIIKKFKEISEPLEEINNINRAFRWNMQIDSIDLPREIVCYFQSKGINKVYDLRLINNDNLFDIYKSVGKAKLIEIMKKIKVYYDFIDYNFEEKIQSWTEEEILCETLTIDEMFKSPTILQKLQIGGIDRLYQLLEFDEEGLQKNFRFNTNSIKVIKEKVQEYGFELGNNIEREKMKILVNHIFYYSYLERMGIESDSINGTTQIYDFFNDNGIQNASDLEKVICNNLLEESNKANLIRKLFKHTIINLERKHNTSRTNEIKRLRAERDCLLANADRIAGLYQKYQKAQNLLEIYEEGTEEYEQDN